MSTEETAADESAAVEVEAVGVDEIVRQERVRAIFSAREDCREKRTKAKNHLSVGESQSWSAVYRNALETYLREVEPLFAQTEAGENYWNEMAFGVVDLRPQYAEIPGSNKTGKLPERMILDDSPLEIRLGGLRSLFEIDTPVQCAFEVRVDSKRLGRGNTVKTATVERHVPIRALDGMYSAVNSYLAEIGFGIQVDQAQQNTKLDDDLMQEVKQWQRENL